MSSNYDDIDNPLAQDDYENRRGGRAGGRRRNLRRVCRFCDRKVDLIDYKDVNLLQEYVPERGKIAPRRLTNVCAGHQRMLAEAIKRARNIALLPYATD